MSPDILSPMDLPSLTSLVYNLQRPLPSTGTTSLPSYSRPELVPDWNLGAEVRGVDLQGGGSDDDVYRVWSPI